MDRIPPPSLINQVVATVAGTIPGSTSITENTPTIPWRRQRIQYRHDEIYIDIVDIVHALIDNKGHVKSARLDGVIECNCKASDTPDISIMLNQAVEHARFHPCVRIGRWQRDNTISFIPPDGRFQLMKYQIAMTKDKWRLPIAIYPSIEEQSQEERRNLVRFVVEVSSHLGTSSGQSITDVAIKIKLFNNGLADIASPALPVDWRLTCNTGHATTEPVNESSQFFHAVIWQIGEIKPAQLPRPRLSGSFTINAGNRMLMDMSVNFTIPGYSISGTRVTSFRLRNVAYQPYKGMKQITRAGRFDVRF